MSRRKIIPLRDRDVSRERLLWAVGDLLAKGGFEGLDVQAVCTAADVPCRALFEHFGGLRGLLAAFRSQPEFWPDAAELAGADGQTLRAMPPAALMAEFFKRFARALLRRPRTLDILAWEARQRTDLTRVLEVGRERTALEFFELMAADPPEDVDLSALVAVVAGAVTFLALRSRRARFYGGIDLASEEGWQRIDRTIEALFRQMLGHG